MILKGCFGQNQVIRMAVFDEDNLKVQRIKDAEVPEKELASKLNKKDFDRFDFEMFMTEL